MLVAMPRSGRQVPFCTKGWIWREDHHPSLGCKYIAHRANGICLKVRLRQWIWMQFHSLIFILKGLPEELQLITIFVSSPSYGSIVFKTQISNSFSSWNAALYDVQIHFAMRRWFAQLLLKVTLCRPELWVWIRLHLNSRGKMMAPPRKKCRRTSKALRAFKRGVRDAWDCA